MVGSLLDIPRGEARTKLPLSGSCTTAGAIRIRGIVPWRFVSARRTADRRV